MLDIELTETRVYQDAKADGRVAIDHSFEVDRVHWLRGS
jgi:hypothetical protein